MKQCSQRKSVFAPGSNFSCEALPMQSILEQCFGVRNERLEPGMAPLAERREQIGSVFCWRDISAHRGRWFMDGALAFTMTA
jgi:hypothetical protein